MTTPSTKELLKDGGLPTGETRDVSYANGLKLADYPVKEAVSLTGYDNDPYVVLKDPSTASPLVFPETVFNAPASHLSAFLGSTAINYTLVGDAGTFLHGLSLAGGWLLEERVDRCLVVAAEEMDWLTADAFRHFDRGVVCAAGAGAVCLGLGDGPVALDVVSPSSSDQRKYSSVTDSPTFAFSASAAHLFNRIWPLPGPLADTTE